MTTTNVAQNVVNEDLPQLLDSIGGSYVINVLAFDVEDFSVGKIDNDSNVEEDTRSSSEFLADLNAEFHDRALLANQKRYYTRSGRVGSAKKPIDKTKETCFACGKLGHFQKDCSSTKTSTPSYPSSHKSYSKPKFQSTSTPQNNQSISNHQKDYKWKYKGLKADIATFTKKIDSLSKGKSEKGLVAESFNWDEESVSSEDEGVTKVKAFMAIAEEELSIRKNDARSEDHRKKLLNKFNSLNQELSSCKSELTDLKNTKALNCSLQNEIIRLNLENESQRDEIFDLKRGKKKDTIVSKEVLFSKAAESPSKTAPEITSNSKSECDIQEPLPPLPKLLGVGPNETSKDDISLADLTLTLTTSDEIKKVFDKRLAVKGRKKKSQPMTSFVPNLSLAKKADSSTKKLILTIVEEVKCLKEKIKIPSDTSPSVSQSGSSISAKGKQRTSIIIKRYGKTTYDEFRGRSPDISYFYVFGCPVHIHNHIDHLGKFDAKANDGFFLGYLPVAKAFRVFNIRRQEIEETYHVTFNEDDEAISKSSTVGDEINLNENISFPDDEFIMLRSIVP
ncbi:retrovirus-related pol polyprotein from transposon TNT 1-94 [Tanacetum coccineum]